MKTIKTAGGLTFAQNESAMFQSMPRTAINEGAVDLVLSPREIAEELKSLAKQKEAYYQALQDLNGETISSRDEHLVAILQMVHKASGVDFGQYKPSTVKRRIIRRVVLHKLNTLNDYVQFIKTNHGELSQLFNDLLINVTTFFRDPELSDYLKNNLLPDIIKNKKHNEPVRIWVPACSTGQEVYSLAILLIEVLGEQYTHLPIQIFATDLSETAINKARLGVYNKDEVTEVSPKRLQRFFTKMDGSYRIIKSIRDLCVFATHNIAKDPPFSRLDIVSCCNLLIYIDNNLQKKIISTFHYALHNNGYLILGKSETVGSSANLFTQLDKKIKIYVKKKDSSSKAVFDMTYHMPDGNKAVATGKQTPFQKLKSDETDLEKAVDQLLLKRFTPASVIIDRDMDIVSFRGSTGLYLEPTPGKASLNLLKMARPGLGFELRNTVHKAMKTGESVKKQGLEFTQDGKVTHIDIEVLPIKTDLDEPYYLVAFEPAASPPETELTAIKDKRVKQLETELAALRDDMRSIIESQEAAVEELQSANEEIVSSNEELQSINEELETSKEEVESSNEELITINQELQLRNEQLTETQDYAEAVFSTIREALVILDRSLRVKTANFVFYKTFNLREEHTEGRLLYDLNHKQWDIPRLRELLEDILPDNTYIHGYEIVHNFAGVGEKSLVVNARRITQKIHGEQLILLAIEDVTEHKRAQQIIQDREAWFRNLADNAPVMIWVTDKEKKSTFFNKAWLEFRGDTIHEAVRKGWTDGVHPDDLGRVVKLFEESFSEKLPFEMKYRVLFQNKEYVWLHNKAKPNFTPEGQFVGYIGSCVVINEVNG
jgi:two-component system CheB/CheR fusion protein